jgi:hypothetical protein
MIRLQIKESRRQRAESSWLEAERQDQRITRYKIQDIQEKGNKDQDNLSV